MTQSNSCMFWFLSHTIIGHHVKQNFNNGSLYNHIFVVIIDIFFSNIHKIFWNSNFYLIWTKLLRRRRMMKKRKRKTRTRYNHGYDHIFSITNVRLVFTLIKVLRTWSSNKLQTWDGMFKTFVKQHCKTTTKAFELYYMQSFDMKTPFWLFKVAWALNEHFCGHLLFFLNCWLLNEWFCKPHGGVHLLWTLVKEGTWNDEYNIQMQ